MRLNTQLEKHDSLVTILDALAILSGIHERLPLDCLPDFSRPDVLRLDRRRNTVFVGDAKNTETPGNRATQVRLRSYLTWLVAFLRRGGSGIFALCFETEALVSGWIDTVLMLASELSMGEPDRNVSSFPPNIIVVRFLWLARKDFEYGRLETRGEHLTNTVFSATFPDQTK